MKTISEQFKEKGFKRNEYFEGRVLANPPKTEFYSRHVKLLNRHQIKNVKTSIIRLRTSSTLLYCEFGESSPTSEPLNVANTIFTASNFHFSKTNGDLVCQLTAIGGKKNLGLAILNDEELFKTLRFTPVFRKVGNWESLASVLVTV